VGCDSVCSLNWTLWGVSTLMENKVYQQDKIPFKLMSRYRFWGLASFYVEAHSVFHALLSFHCEDEGGIGPTYISFRLANAHIEHYINKLALCFIILK
jgi:hypothetical protein